MASPAKESAVVSVAALARPLDAAGRAGLEARTGGDCSPLDTARPPANRTWPLPQTTNGTGGSGEFLAFSSAKLAATGAPAADVSARRKFKGDIAFAPDGSVWVLGPTTEDAHLQHYPAAVFASSGEKTPDLEINVGSEACIPMVEGLALDAAGNLYLSSPCRRAIYRLDAAQLERSSGPGAPTAPATVLTSADLGYAQNVAFYPAPAALPLASRPP